MEPLRVEYRINLHNCVLKRIKISCARQGERRASAKIIKKIIKIIKKMSVKQQNMTMTMRPFMCAWTIRHTSSFIYCHRNFCILIDLLALRL